LIQALDITNPNESRNANIQRNNEINCKGLKVLNLICAVVRVQPERVESL